MLKLGKTHGRVEMKLSFDQLKSITFGAARIEECDEGVNFFRFTTEQEEMYKNGTRADFYKKCLSSAGISFEFDTDSENLTLGVCEAPGSSRNYFTFSIFSNNERIGELTENFCHSCKKIAVKKYFSLGEGKKHIKIIFPWSAKSCITELCLDDGAEITPYTKSLKMLIFGDSITQGYNAVKPENSYATQLAAALDADAVNKGIGGEFFHPELAAMRDGFEPDVITVAYGTNDWNARGKDKFLDTSRRFYENLISLYPNARIFALAPIWRADHREPRDVGSFKNVGRQFETLAAELGHITVIDCFSFVPFDPECFSDKFLHPNDLGFLHYGRNLADAIKKELGK